MTITPVGSAAFQSIQGSAASSKRQASEVPKQADPGSFAPTLSRVEQTPFLAKFIGSG
jgi:hypothetical protein